MSMLKSDRSNKQIREYFNAARKGGKFIFPKEDKWRISQSDKSEVKLFDSLEKALSQAKKEVFKSGVGNIFVFNQNGEIDRIVKNKFAWKTLINSIIIQPLEIIGGKLDSLKQKH